MNQGTDLEGGSCIIRSTNLNLRRAKVMTGGGGAVEGYSLK